MAVMGKAAVVRQENCGQARQQPRFHGKSGKARQVKKTKGTKRLAVVGMSETNQ